MPNLMLDDLYPAMPWDRIDNVVFDVGNVLLRFSPEDFLKELVPERPELHAALLQRVFRSPYWIMMDYGEADCRSAGDMMSLGHPELEPYIRRIMSGWKEMRVTVPEGVAALRCCREHGKRIFILSNYGDDSFAVVEEKYDFLREADGRVVSSREHLMKPDPAIYRLLTDRYGLDPARTLFIDDSTANICVPLALGWQGICFNEAGKLERFFDLNA